MHDSPRKPDCGSCPLDGHTKVWGQGPLTAEILLVAEAPGVNEEESGIPLVGWTGTFVNASLAYYGHPRSEVRVENVFQCRAPYGSKQGKQAASVCGRTIWDSIRAMPNLRSVLAFGEAALRELSGYRAQEERERDYKREAKAFASWERKRLKAERSYAAKLEKYNAQKAKKQQAYEVKLQAWEAKPGKRKAPKPPTISKEVVRPAIFEEPLRSEPIHSEQTSVCAHGISNYRGSPLWLKGYEGRIRLFPIIHPAACAPRRKPQLRPLIMSDLRRATEFHSGKRSEQIPSIQAIRDPETLRQFLEGLQGGRVALDIEWSRRFNEFVCIGLGTGVQVGVLVFADSSGWRMAVAERAQAMSLLQEAFSEARFEWGGHFVAGYDEHKLASQGLHVQCRWDSLYAFHILYADLGSAVDEDATEYLGKKRGSAAGGYDLGFVSSVLTNMPYHKYMLQADALDMPPKDLVEYCGRDVAACWLAQAEMDRVGAQTMPQGAFQRELEFEMELTRRAQKMSRRGVPINEEERQRRLKQWETTRDGIGTTLSFNIGSSQQLAKALEARGIKIRRNPDTGLPKLDGNEISKLLRKHPQEPLLKLVGEYRRAEKEITAYNQIAPASWDGRAHPSWKVHGTVGTRWSSTPNYQNLTKEQRECIG